MVSKLMVSLGFLVILVLLPVLEVSATHVVNPDWPPHARLHNLWQLVSNGLISMVGLWLVWQRAAVRLAAVLGAAMIGGALIAHLLADLYGGAMAYESGPDTIILGLHISVLIPIVVLGLFAMGAMCWPGSRSVHDA